MVGLQHGSIHTHQFLLQSMSGQVLFGLCFDLPPKWESITHLLLTVFEIKTVTSFCKYTLHQQKQFLNHPAELIAHTFIYQYVQHQ